MLEKDIEKKVCDEAKKLGWLTYKFSSPAHRGVPDRIFIKDGEVVFIEFKGPNGVLSTLQRICMFDIGMAGASVYCCHSVEQALERLTSHA